MARLPTAEDLGVATPVSSRPIQGYNATEIPKAIIGAQSNVIGAAAKQGAAAGEVTAGIQAAGRGIETFGDREMALNDGLEAAAGGSRFLQGRIALDKDLEQNQGDPNGAWADYNNWADTYASKLDALKKDAISKISNPETAAKVSLNLDNQAAEAVGTVQKKAFTRGAQVSLGWLEDNGNGLVNYAGSTPNLSEQDAFGMMKSQGDIVNSFVAKGYMSAPEGVNYMRQFRSQFADSGFRGYAPNDRISILHSNGIGDQAGAPVVSSSAANTNLPPEARALLDTIAGPESGGAYNVRYTPQGGATFASYTDHPRVKETIPSGPYAGQTSDAGGRYQMLSSTYDPVAQQLGLKGFSPENQDSAAWQIAQNAYKQQTGGGDLLGALRAGKLSQVQDALRNSRQWDTANLTGYSANLAKYDAGEAGGAAGGSAGPAAAPQANAPAGSSAGAVQAAAAQQAPGGPAVAPVPNAAANLNRPFSNLPGSAGNYYLSLLNPSQREPIWRQAQADFERTSQDAGGPLERNIIDAEAGLSPLMPRSQIENAPIKDNVKNSLLIRYDAAANKMNTGLKQTTARAVNDDLASMLATGQGVQGIDPTSVAKVLGPERAAEWLDKRQTAQAAYTATADLPSLPIGDIATRVDALKPKPGEMDFARKETVYNHVLQSVTKLQEQRKTDPALSVMGAPPVSTALTALGQNPDDPALAQRAVQASLDEQNRIGIPPESQHALTNNQASGIVANIQAAARTGQDVGASLDQMAQKYGPHWPTVFGDLVKQKLPNDYQALAMMDLPSQQAGRLDLQHAISLRNEKGGMKAMEEAAPATVRATLNDTALDTALDPFLKTFTIFPNTGTSAANAYLMVKDAAKTLAYYRAGIGGQDPQTAMDSAVRDVIGRYDIDGTIRAPKGQMSSVKDAADAITTGLKSEDVAPVPMPGVPQGNVTPPKFDTQTATGMVAPGNLDPWNRPVLKNPGGGYSTTSSMSIGTDKGETLIPTVVNGRRLTEQEAIGHFRETGENLGVFDTPDNANAYATALHNAQASMYDAEGNPKSRIAADADARGRQIMLNAEKRWYANGDDSGLNLMAVLPNGKVEQVMRADGKTPVAFSFQDVPGILAKAGPRQYQPAQYQSQ